MTDGDCLFCRIVSKDVPAQVVLDRDDLTSLEAVGDRHEELLASLVAAANEVAREDGVAGAYRLVTNVGRGAGQSVDHLHLHVLGGRGFTWPPG